MMLSFTKAFTTFPSQISSPSQHRHHTRSLVIIRSSDDNDNNIDISASPPVVPPITPPQTVEIRFKRGSRRRKKQEQDALANKTPPKKVQKDWDSMTLSEKAVELYMGEKGALFWLNKFAYASIFIVIGGWILFRFVGPALDLYQLDTPPLAPDSLFKGS
ncbi:hypothetical protein PHJA_001225000 [Phtheirospermum japonicum]|uniref:Transmembrane protein n=1 Tax=Phtheirospermum japonicum TaxID=374723 RepID=A0A830BWR7_9LAMI|nr:hypothetical protein PHJA_001224800 [Phtheirospermum japonicum]GFP90811.1 hypothetical protein PHJA_001225000 [Phtheirospermum japonicum]